MIASLKGVLAEKNDLEVVVEAGGVGYRVFLSAQAAGALPELGQVLSLRIRTVVREDALDLFGFLTRTEEALFLLLNSVSGVGPKMAMNVLSGLVAEELVAAISKAEVARLTKIHGVGKKTAERIVLELKDEVKALRLEPRGGAPRPAPASATVTADLVSALINLGYREPQAEAAAAAAAERAGEGAAFELVFREALKALRG